MPLTDSALNSEALVIKNETILRANTAIRVGTMLQHLIDNKINNDKIDTNPALGTSNTSIPSQAAVRSYVDGRTLNDILTAGNVSSQEIGVGAINLGAGSFGRIAFGSDTFTFLDSNPNDIFSIKDSELNILSNAGATAAKITSSALSTSRTFNLPDKNGTFAMTSDIPVVPKRFIALISQSGTANPTFTVIRNDFAGTISAIRTGVGAYTITNTLSEFTLNKTSACINNSTNFAVKFTGATRTLDTVVALATASLSGGGIPADTLLLNDIVQIEVYP